MINEAEKMKLDAETIRIEIAQDFEIFLSLSLIIWEAIRYRSGPEIQNHSESSRLVVFSHMRSYILIIRQNSCANLYISWDFSLFEYNRDYSEEFVDPRRNIKI